MPGPVLDVQDLSITYSNGCVALRGVDLAIHPGECVALVGESGSGKTTLARAIVGLLPPSARTTGSITMGDTELLGLTAKEWRSLRGRTVGFVAQDPYAACDPLRTVGHHVRESWRAHGEHHAPADPVERLEDLGIPHPSRYLKDRPHQWSGGMLQRATAVAALIHDPPLLVADEPTSALDADLADGLLASLRVSGKSILLISHDLELAAKHSDRIAVMYAGRIVEHGTAGQLQSGPRHPYSQALLAASPTEAGVLPQELQGSAPSTLEGIVGCSFAPRCAHVHDACQDRDPELVDGVACHLSRADASW